MTKIVMDRSRWPLGRWMLAVACIAVVALSWQCLLPDARQAPSAPPQSDIWRRAPQTLVPLPDMHAAPGPGFRSMRAPPATVVVNAPLVSPRQLAVARVHLAESFLNEVRVVPASRGGFIVKAITHGSLWQRMGLQAGDVVFTLDNPAMAAINENSMIALTQQTTLEMDVYRAGVLLHLQLQLNRDDDDAGSESNPQSS